MKKLVIVLKYEEITTGKKKTITITFFTLVGKKQLT